MTELNREDIIKALEWCIQSEGCEYCEYNKGNVDVCNIRSDALALIKNLIKENERLQEKANRHLDNLKAVLDERAEEKSEVARKIFAEIKQKIKTVYNKWVFELDLDDTEKELVMDLFQDLELADFEKKYIGEGKDVL